MSPKVSIIIPVYNGENYIRICLKSLINQTLKEIEIIFIDDGSTDNSISIIEEFSQKDSRIKLLTQNNKKTGAARNNGIKNATGEYIGFVDQDDYIDENFFEELYNTAKINDADIAAANILKHKHNSLKYNIKYKNYKTTKDIQEKIKLCSYKKSSLFHCWNKIYRKSFLDKQSIFFPENRFHEDILFTLTALYYSDILAVTPNTKYHYITNPDSVCNSKKDNSVKTADKIYYYKQMQMFAKEHDVNLPEKMNYYKTFWSTPIIKSYKGYFKTKEKLFGILPINKQVSKLFKLTYSSRSQSSTKYSFIFCGLKLCIPKKQTRKSLQDMPFLKYKENNTDITTLPKAEGQIRDIQLANLELLKELDYVCKQNNLEYWLDGGTLLGAVRHKGYIPWDDDIDTAMPRKDYEKIIKAFETTSRNPDIFADYNPSEFQTEKSYFIKIQHKKCPHLFVDIFPFDTYGRTLTTEEQLKETINIKNIRSKDLKRHINVFLSDKEIQNRINKLRELILFKNQENDKTDFVWGVDFKHTWKNWFTAYNVVYPLKTIEFENIEFPCINNPHAYLTRLYKNYMDYPSKITFGHSAYETLCNEEQETIQQLISEAKQ